MVIGKRKGLSRFQAGESFSFVILTSTIQITDSAAAEIGVRFRDEIFQEATIYTCQKRHIVLISAYIVLSFLKLFETSMRAMLNLPEKHFQTDNANPALLELALTPKDFSEEYRWYYQSLTGYEWEAISELGGHYRGYRFDIFQSVAKYNQDLFWTKDSDFQYLSGPVALSGVHNLQDIGVADFQKTECLFDLDDRITCRMNIGDLDVGMELEINYHNQDDKNAMKSILNLLIDTIGEKLKSL